MSPKLKKKLSCSKLVPGKRTIPVMNIKKPLLESVVIKYTSAARSQQEKKDITPIKRKVPVKSSLNKISKKLVISSPMKKIKRKECFSYNSCKGSTCGSCIFCVDNNNNKLPEREVEVEEMMNESMEEEEEGVDMGIFTHKYNNDAWSDEYHSDFDEVSDDSNMDNYSGFNYLDVWDDENDENNYKFNSDEERPIFNFDPLEEYFDLQQESSDGVTITYQALYHLGKMIAELLGAWERRNISDIETPDPSPLPDDYCLNLSQMESEQRNKLKAHSMLNLERLFGGKEDVMNVKQTANSIISFSKRMIMKILENSLPCNLPYPVMNTILSCTSSLSRVL